jgi:hypothetical protein
VHQVRKSSDERKREARTVRGCRPPPCTVQGPTARWALLRESPWPAHTTLLLHLPSAVSLQWIFSHPLARAAQADDPAEPPSLQTRSVRQFAISLGCAPSVDCAAMFCRGREANRKCQLCAALVVFLVSSHMQSDRRCGASGQELMHTRPSLYHTKELACEGERRAR